MLDAPSNTIKCRNENNRELLVLGIRDQRIQSRTSGSTPRNPTILIFLDDRKAPLRRKLAKVVKLAFDALIGGANADIDCCL